jgi:hypothetical protein
LAHSGEVKFWAILVFAVWLKTAQVTVGPKEGGCFGTPLPDDFPRSTLPEDEGGACEVLHIAVGEHLALMVAAKDLKQRDSNKESAGIGSSKNSSRKAEQLPEARRPG